MTNLLKNKWAVLVAGCLLVALKLPLAQAQGPAVGTEIVNQAAVSYTDSNGEDQYTTTNEVVLVVQQVYSATIESDRVASAIPGDAVRFLHTLINTGNGTDSYQINVADDNANGADSGDFVNIQVFHDLNNNGQVDAGEPVVANAVNGGTLTLDADELASLIILGQLPAGAVDGDVYDLTLTTQAYEGGASPVTGSVEDLTSGNGIDGLDDSNEDRVTVTNDAVLVVSKSSVYNEGAAGDPNDDSITYTITVANNGLSTAFDIAVLDALPSQVSFNNAVAVSSSNAAAFDAPNAGSDDGSNGLPGSLPAHDGGTPGNMVGEIDTLAAGASVDFSFDVLVNAGVAAGTVIQNQVTVQGDVDGDGNADDPVDSNQTVDTVPATYGVLITDTGTIVAFDPAAGAGSPAVNDGADDDTLANDIQFVDQVPQGAEVIFTNVIRNLGNGDDAFNLEVIASDFPAGTTFQFFAADGFTPLLDSNDDGIPDSGLMSPFAVTGEERAIVVRAQLPTDAVVAAAVNAQVLATSTADPALTPSSDDVFERLGFTVQAAVDIANSAGATGLGDDSVDADPASAITTTLIGQRGDLLVFDLFIANESDNSDSYDLTAHADAAATQNLPSWLQVTFVNINGDTISSADNVLPGAVFAFQARVALSAQAPVDATQSIFFTSSSTLSGASDVKQDAVTVLAEEQITMLTDQTGNVEPCGGVTYTHTVSNSGGTQEDIQLVISSQSQLSSLLLFATAVAGNEPTDFVLQQSLSVGDEVAVYNATTAQWELRQLVSNGAGGFATPTNPGDYFQVQLRITAACDTSLALEDVVVLTASVVDGAATVSNTDITTVGTVFLDLVKLGALDRNCDNTPDTDFLSAQVNAAPDECVIWQITATNSSSQTTCNVRIQDVATTFTRLAPGSATVFSEPAPGTGICTEDAPNVECAVGNDIEINQQPPVENHCIRPGEIAEMRFRVVVE